MMMATPEGRFIQHLLDLVHYILKDRVGGSKRDGPFDLDLKDPRPPASIQSVNDYIIERIALLPTL